MSINFTLVSTVYNEIDKLSQTISNIESQTLLPSEIIITDAGSQDGTYEKLLEWARNSKLDITILQEKGCNVARGRNLAIRKSKYELIASTDFGCIHDQGWLESIINPFIEIPDIEIVGGASSIIENDMISLAQKTDFILNNGYQVVIDPNGTISSRSIAFRKNVWEKLGGYPEWLTLAADDSVFWRLIRKFDYKYQLVQDVKVYWIRHKTFVGFAKEAKRYGLGGGESRTNMRNFISHLVHIFSRYIGAILIVLAFALNSFSLIFLVPGIFALLFGLRSHFATLKNWLGLRSTKYNFITLLASFYMIESQRLSYVYGYLKGLVFSSTSQRQEAKKLQVILQTGLTTN